MPRHLTIFGRALARRRALAFASLVAFVTTGAACTRELHRRQGAVLVTGDGWGEIAPCG